MNPFAPSKYCFPCTDDHSVPAGQVGHSPHHSSDSDRGMSSAPGLGADTLDLDEVTIARILTAREHY
jgi:hypothetical protein